MLGRKEPEMIVTVAKDGKLTIEVDGVQGTSCETFTKDFVNALGGKGETTKKSDYYVKPIDATVKTKLA